MNPGLPEEQIFALPIGIPVTIGRTKDNAVFCLHKSLSRRHAQVDFDGECVNVTDLQSKNGVIVNGQRITRCKLLAGDSFRCGDITFLIETSTTPTAAAGVAARLPRQEVTAQTLPSLLALGEKAKKLEQPPPQVTIADEQRHREKLLLLVQASELCVRETRVDRILDELVTIAARALDLERIALLTLDLVTMEMKPRVMRTVSTDGRPPYSRRVVEWIVHHGRPATFADVSRDPILPGPADEDADVRAAMCAPINPGNGIIGAVYADSLSLVDRFGSDDLAFLRALANLGAMTIERSFHRSDTS